MNCIDLAWDNDRLRTVLNVVMKLAVAQDSGSLLTS